MSLSIVSANGQNLSVETMIVMLNNPTKSPLFYQALDKQLSSENGNFYKDYLLFEIEHYMMNTDDIRLKLEWFEQEYIRPDALKELNLPKHVVETFETDMQAEKYEFEILNGIKREVLKMMYQNTYRLGDFEKESKSDSPSKSAVKKGSCIKRFFQRTFKKTY